MFEALKGMIYETPPAAKPAASVGSASIPAVTTAATSATFTTGVNADMVAAIKKVTYGRNSAFTQLVQTAEALADVIPDQTMRLKAAFKTTAAGRTGRQIADAVDVHLADVDGEERKFNALIDQKISSDVGALQASADAATQQMQAAQNEVQQLQQRIIDLQNQAGQLAQTASAALAQVTTKKGELDASRTEFKLAAQAVRNELSNSKAAILATLV